ncbi:MAG: mechanosensitive ion channel family protein [Bacteroidales bacterium]|nr:mechanosensitive ion channel family protein [Bacteroidales bacterium]MCF8402643.1 mechanosensitive ion channel family protein [Bacteroidales bacterium]
MDDFVNTWLFNSTVGKLVAVILSIVIIWSVMKVLKFKIAGPIKSSDNRYRTRKLLDFTGYFIMILMITVIFSDKLGGLTVALGVAGAGIAFALQEVIASVAGWLAILFAGFYKTGDRVQLGGIKGDVIDVNVLRTTLMETGQWVDGDLYNGRIVRIANSFVFKEPVFNYSGDFPFLWDEIKIPVQFGSDYEKARELFLKVTKEITHKESSEAALTWKHIVSKFMIEDASTEPMVTLIANDNWVEYTIRYVVNYKRRRITKDKLFSKILSAVESVNSGIKFASATFQLVEGSEIKVAVKEI